MNISRRRLIALSLAAAFTMSGVVAAYADYDSDLAAAKVGGLTLDELKALAKAYPAKAAAIALVAQQQNFSDVAIKQIAAAAKEGAAEAGITIASIESAVKQATGVDTSTGGGTTDTKQNVVGESKSGSSS